MLRNIIYLLYIVNYIRMMSMMIVMKRFIIRCGI